MAPKISVIVPMYNAERYVGLAIESILAQEFRDFELILIDDCSTDRTLEVAKSINDPRIRIIENEENLGGENGSGVVRNIGIEKARGEYIYFMDNDDVILPDALEVMLKAAIESKADVLINTKNFLVENNEFTSFDEISNLTIRGQDKLTPIAGDLKKRLFEEYALKNSPAAQWNHFCRHDFLKSSGIKFRNAIIHDDGIWLLELLCATSNIIKIAEPFYIARQRDESLAHSTALGFDGFAKRVRSFLIVLESFEEILSKALEREYGEVDYYFIDQICLSVKDRAIVGPLKHAYNTDPQRCWQIVKRELETHYGTDMPLLRKMMHGYFVEVLYNKSIDEKENLRLRLTMKTLKERVNRLIPF